MLNSKFRNTVNGLRIAERRDDTGVEDLRTEVNKLNESVNLLMEKLHNAETTSSLTTSTYQETSVEGEQQLLSSTVLQKNDSVQQASREVKPRLATEQPPNRSLDERKLTLHLSNIANDVTEQEVAEMVADVFDIDRVPAVQLLVPSWKDKSSLEYISFKVEIDASLKSKALTTSNWPFGVRCREFRDYSRNVWRPVNRSI